jgi:hypothetical protein
MNGPLVAVKTILPTGRKQPRMCEACGNPNLSHDAVTASAADAASKPVWTNQQVIDQLDSGLHWSGTNLTLGFRPMHHGSRTARRTGSANSVLRKKPPRLSPSSSGTT